ncbi:MAG: hypothetical protein VB137_09475 [Burkholderia sp.]
MARTRQIGDQTTTQQTCLISSRPMKAGEMSRLAHTHWGIENQLHWVLDVSWGEDAQQTRNKSRSPKSRVRVQVHAEPGAHGATAATAGSQPEEHP